MTFKSLASTLVASLFILSTSANASLLVEQFDDFWSTDVNKLKNYANTHVASSAEYWDVIDFTDDPAGFAGLIPGSNFWPSANGANLGTGSAINSTFFAKITGSFSTSIADTFQFRTYSDDGVFLYIDGDLIINDPNLHPEIQNLGSKTLGIGNHSIELYFFENTGEASLEFSVADSSGNFTHFNNSNSVALVNVPEPSTTAILALGLIGFAARRHKKSN